MDIPEVPTCGVFIRKEKDQPAIACPNPAAYVIQLADPDDPTHTRITSILLLCEEHSRRFDAGHSLILTNSDGEIEIARAEPDILEPKEN